MKFAYLAVILVVVGILGFLAFGPKEVAAPTDIAPVSGEEPAPATYTVVPEESVVNWSGKKPLIEGYINTGTIEVSSGTVTITDTGATGSFTMDMDTLHVGLTATKPGSEGALEGHLKGERWFNVAEYPTATFAITSVERGSEASTYDIQGNLTMKGQTHPVSFPAKIYILDGRLIAEGATEIDRTEWGLTANSADFFDNLADNAIANEVALSFKLVAAPQ